METKLVPNRALMRRHTAAMEIIHQLDRNDRMRVLCFVVGFLQDDRIDQALVDADAARARRSEERERAQDELRGRSRVTA